MIELPPDLPRLRTLRAWHAMCLRTVDAAITAAEQRAAEQERGKEQRPPTPDWMVERGIGQGAPPIEVHIGGCHMARNTQAVTRGQALQALVAGVRACIHCRPDTELGILE
ncbi:DUF6233 domain-containing protein [Streptomyces sp. NPDC097727]|uniref:DUF6233 domain-containing protein n=1 Tax=Streptomyces sp. NPDC097727 TaxID=3366092 RepID=UPI003801EB18